MDLERPLQDEAQVRRLKREVKLLMIRGLLRRYGTPDTKRKTKSKRTAEIQMCVI
jgi:hypothetical protein